MDRKTETSAPRRPRGVGGRRDGNGFAGADRAGPEAGGREAAGAGAGEGGAGERPAARRPPQGAVGPRRPGKSCGAAGTELRRREDVMSAVTELAEDVGVSLACRAFSLPRSTFYRRSKPAVGHRQPRPTPARALSRKERSRVYEVLCSERFVDASPAETAARLLDEGVYLVLGCTGCWPSRTAAHHLTPSRSPHRLSNCTPSRLSSSGLSRGKRSHRRFLTASSVSDTSTGSRPAQAAETPSPAPPVSLPAGLA